MELFDHEILVDAHTLKLKIQSEIMNHYQELVDSKDIGLTSWIIADRLVEGLRRPARRRPDCFDAKLCSNPHSGASEVK